MTDTPDIEALVAELRKYSRPPFDRAALYIKPLRDAADALERQQAVVEAARPILRDWQDGSGLDICNYYALRRTLAALDAQTERERT